jgi:hypothetical protein
MKITVHFKTPDAVFYALQSAFPEMDEDEDVEEDEDEKTENKLAVSELISEFVEHDECVTVEFDTEAGTATVVPVM